jgi:hypothetical protein
MKNPRCTVIPSGARPWWLEPDLEYKTCGKPTVGERAGFPMCREHHELFDPARDIDDTWIFADNEMKKVETIEDPEGRV